MNGYGKELVSMCQSARLRIVNGCCGKDKGVGQYTCFFPQGVQCGGLCANFRGPDVSHTRF